MIPASERLYDLIVHKRLVHARLGITREQRLRDGYRCIACGTTADLTLDHVIALAVEVRRVMATTNS